MNAKDEPIGVLGLGHVGLPLALSFAEAGMRVIGCDTDRERTRLLARGLSPFRYIESERVRVGLREKTLSVTTDFRRLRQVRSAIICVPTPLTPQREPDLSFVISAAERIAAHARPGVLVVLESTTYPGTTREVVRPILESRGWRLGREFHLAFSPEREDPSNTRYTLRNTPKLIGGMERKSLERARALYEHVVERVVPVSSCEVAEAAKLLENIFRAVNVALVNELKVIFHKMNVDIWDVIAAAGTKPFGFMPFFPGPGLGGHCTPIDPFYLTWKAREFDLSTKFIELAGEVNTRMPYFVLDRVRDALNQHGFALRGSRILLLGVAYKRNVNDTRESPALKLMTLLDQAGARVDYHDPHVPRVTYSSPRSKRRSSVSLSPRTIASANLVLLTTDHDAVEYSLVKKHARLIVDTRRVFRPDQKRIFGA